MHVTTHISAGPGPAWQAYTGRGLIDRNQCRWVRFLLYQCATCLQRPPHLLRAPPYRRGIAGCTHGCESGAARGAAPLLLPPVSRKRPVELLRQPLRAADVRPLASPAASLGCLIYQATNDCVARPWRCCETGRTLQQIGGPLEMLARWGRFVRRRWVQSITTGFAYTFQAQHGARLSPRAVAPRQLPRHRPPLR